MKWVTRARPKTDRIACPWLIRRFIDPDAEILYVPTDEVLAVAARPRAPTASTPPAPSYDHRDNKCTFEVLIDDYDLGDDPALVRLAAIVHAADIETEIDTDPFAPGLLAIGLGGLDVEADDHRLLERAIVRLRRPLRLVRPAGRGRRGMTEHLGYDDLRADTVRQVAKLMAAAAITAPKSGGQLFLAGKHNFMETVIVDDPDTRHELAEWMRARGKERREAIWFRDADVAEAIDAVLLVGHRRLVPTQLRLRRLRLRHLRRVPPRHQDPARRLRRARVRRPDLQPARHRPRHRRRLRRQDRRHPLHRLPLPDPHRRRRPQARHHPRRHRRRPLPVAHPQGRRVRPPHPRGRLRHPRLPATGTLPIGVEGGERHGGVRNRQQPRTRSGQSRTGDRSEVEHGRQGDLI